MNRTHEFARLTAKRDWAKRATEDQLLYAIADCQRCILVGSPASDRYRDEIAEYRAALGRRERRHP